LMNSNAGQTTLDGSRLYHTLVSMHANLPDPSESRRTATSTSLLHALYLKYDPIWQGIGIPSYWTRPII
jgi:hypothetical protein